MVASCRGVVKMKPWPIAEMTVSPSYQLVPKRFFFHALVGISPERSAPNGNPVF